MAAARAVDPPATARDRQAAAGTSDRPAHVTAPWPLSLPAPDGRRVYGLRAQVMASATAFGRVLWAVGCKGCLHRSAVLQTGFDQLEAGARALCRGLQLLEAGPL